MTFIFCLDDKKGLLFNKRRQSSDAAVFADIATLFSSGGMTLPISGGAEASSRGAVSPAEPAATLYITSFSEKLISSAGLKYKLWDGAALPSELLPGSAFFVENFSAKPFLEKADKLIIYWWNRRYPGDYFLDFLPEDEGFHSVEKYDFPGKSHEKITREIYAR